jgi:hypothetical protein
VFPERQEGIVVPGSIALVKLPSEALGISNAKIAGLLLPGVPNWFWQRCSMVYSLAFPSPMDIHNGGPGRSKKPSIQ